MAAIVRRAFSSCLMPKEKEADYGHFPPIMLSYPYGIIAESEVSSIEYRKSPTSGLRNSTEMRSFPKLRSNSSDYSTSTVTTMEN
jgi:hypothetical protein